MTRTNDKMTAQAICRAYREGGADTRRRLRSQYPRLHLEFDAIDRDEERALRVAAKRQG